MLRIKTSPIEPTKFALKGLDPSGDTFVTIRPASMNDESRRYAMLFENGQESVYVTHIAAVEIYITLMECNILDENEKVLLDPTVEFPVFVERLTSLWRHSTDAIWEIQKCVHEINPQWGARGNA